MSNITEITGDSGSYQSIAIENPDSFFKNVPSELLEEWLQKEIAKRSEQEQHDPMKKYFKGNRFVPKLLAEDILNEISVLTMKDTKEIYVYENGVYRQGGEDAIKQLAQRKLGEEARRIYQTEVVNYITNIASIIKNREDFNKETRIINLKNGLYDLNIGEFREHTPDFLSTIQIPVNYNTNARCPTVDKFLPEVVSEKDRKVLLEFAGYAIVPENKIKKSFMLLGTGDNGKTVFLEFLRMFIGEENTSSESLQNLSNNRYSSANLYGKLLNIASDMSDSQLNQTNILKALTGRDKIRGEKKFHDAFDFENTARLIFAANKLPEPKDANDNAFFKRWIFITFPNKFEGENADENLLEKLTTEEELSGFLNQALEALKELLNRGEFSDSKTVEELKKIYLTNSDSVSAFIDEYVEKGTDEKVYKETMYEAYVKWCPNSVNPVDKKSFDGKVKDNGIESRRDSVKNANGKREYYWRNVSIIA